MIKEIKKYKYFLIGYLSCFSIAGYLIFWKFPFPPVFFRMILLIISFYCIFILKIKFLFCEKIILIFSLINLLYFFLGSSWNQTNITQIGNIMCVTLPIVIFSIISENQFFTDIYLNIYIIILLICSILNFYYFKNHLIELLLLQPGTDVVNNASECFLNLIPLILLIRNNILKLVILLICIFFLILGAKRGNIIAACIPIFLIIYYEFKINKKSIAKLSILVLIIICANLCLYNYIYNNNFIMYRIEETINGKTSGRENIYNNAWHVWYDSDNISNQIFGHGFNNTRVNPKINVNAHSDWLEILVDYGVFGIIIYISIFYSLFYQAYKIEDLKMKIIILSSIFIWLLKSIYSMGFLSNYFPILMISMGIVLGKYKFDIQRNDK